MDILMDVAKAMTAEYSELVAQFKALRLKDLRYAEKADALKEQFVDLRSRADRLDGFTEALTLALGERLGREPKDGDLFEPEDWERASEIFSHWPQIDWRQRDEI